MKRNIEIDITRLITMLLVVWEHVINFVCKNKMAIIGE